MVSGSDIICQCKLKNLTFDHVRVGIEALPTLEVFQMLQGVFYVIIHACVRKLELFRKLDGHDL